MNSKSRHLNLNKYTIMKDPNSKQILILKEIVDGKKIKLRANTQIERDIWFQAINQHC